MKIISNKYFIPHQFSLYLLEKSIPANVKLNQSVHQNYNRVQQVILIIESKFSTMFNRLERMSNMFCLYVQDHQIFRGKHVYFVLFMHHPRAMYIRYARSIIHPNTIKYLREFLYKLRNYTL